MNEMDLCAYIVYDISTKGWYRMANERNKKQLGAFRYLTPELAREQSVSKYQFYNYVRENGLEQVSHGIYAAPDTWVDELYVLHQRCPQAVFSHDEAFYYYGLTDREPLVHTLTIYSGYNTHRLIADGSCRVYTVKKELLDAGRIMVRDNAGNEIPMYDLERTICDLVRSRNSIEAQDFNAVLKAYVARQDKDLNRLMYYAERFHVHNILRKYIEVLL